MKKLRVKKVMEGMKETARSIEKVDSNFSIRSYYAGASSLLDMLKKEGFITKNQAVPLDTEFTNAVYEWHGWLNSEIEESASCC